MKKVAINLVVFILLASWSARGQANNSITGFVFGTERQSVPDLPIELLDEFNRLLVRVRTDNSGRFGFNRLVRGRYSVHTSTSGTIYEEQTVEVEIAGLSQGGQANAGSDSIQQNIYLRTRRSNDPNVVHEVVFVQEVPSEAKRSYENAISLLKAKKTEAAISEFKTALKIFPDYYLALSKLGQCYLDLQNFSEARDPLSKAVSVNSRDHGSQYALGYTLYMLGNFPEALAAIDQSLIINPSSVNSLFLLGVTLKKLSKFDEAVQSLKKAAKLSKVPSPEIHWQLSLLYTNNLKNYRSAADELELFLKAKPDYDEAGKVKELIKKLRLKTKNVG